MIFDFYFDFDWHWYWWFLNFFWFLQLQFVQRAFGQNFFPSNVFCFCLRSKPQAPQHHKRTIADFVLPHSTTNNFNKNAASSIWHHARSGRMARRLEPIPIWPQLCAVGRCDWCAGRRQLSSLVDASRWLWLPSLLLSQQLGLCALSVRLWWQVSRDNRNFVEESFLTWEKKNTSLYAFVC